MSDLYEHLPLGIHGRFEDDWYWEANDQEIGNDIARSHGNELDIAFPAPRSWVWDYLPVVVERLTFREGGDHDSDEGNG